MARIAGVDLPRTKRVEIGLTYIYGIGRKRSNDILTASGVSPDIRVKDLSEDDVRKISRVIEEQGGVDRARLDGCVAIPPRVELVTGVVAVNQVDPACYRRDPVHHRCQIIAARVRMAGIKTETDGMVIAVRVGEVGDGVPQAGDRVEAAGHRVIPASGVLDEQWHGPLYALHRLAPVGVAFGLVYPAGHVPAVHDEARGPHRGGSGELLAEQLAAGNPDPVVRARHVDPVGRVDEHLQAGLAERGPELAGVTAGERRRVPALRIAEEELDDLSPGGVRHPKRVAFAFVSSDADHAPSVAGRSVSSRA